jgi:dTDP-L-rhamnose 4-epimerase
VKSNVLISGGAGFIGTEVARSLLSQGHSVTLLDNFSPQVHGENTALPEDLAPHVHLVRADVRDPDAWAIALPGHDTIVNLAAETGTGQSMYEVSKYEQVNLAGTALLYDHLAKNARFQVKRIVVASSRAIYGEGAYRCDRDGVVYPRSRSTAEKKLGLFNPLCPVCGGKCIHIPTPETAPMEPSSFYGLSKQMQEQMTLLFARVLGIPSFALRYQNVYGPGQSLRNPYTGILAIFTNQTRLGAELSVFEDGFESRDFVFIDDVVRATVACIDRADDVSGAINVGSGECTSILEVAHQINEHFGGRSQVKVTGAFRDGDIRHGLADLTQARALLGYVPQWSFRDGLRRFLAWADQGKANSEGYERSLTELRERGLLHAKS